MDKHVPSAPPESTGAESSRDAPAGRAADIRSLWLAILIIAGSAVVQAAGRITEVNLHRAPTDPAEIWLLETISHLAILTLIPAVFLMLDYAPIHRSSWRRWAPIHALGAFGFAAAHIAVVALARELAFPPVLGRPYTGDLFSPERLFAEVRKDILIYAIVALGLAGNRAIERHREATRTALREVRRSGALTLKSGGHTYIVNAADIMIAKSAENYVEVQTQAKTYLVRMTLTQLERLLTEASTRHVRVHRSYIVNLAHVASVAPTGEGDVLITLSNGAEVPGSRRFRDRLQAELDPS